MAHTSVEFGQLVNKDDLDVVQFASAASPGLVALDKSDSNRWKQADASTSEVLAGKDGIGLLIQTVTKVDGWGTILRPKEGRVVLVYIDSLSTGDVGSGYVVGTGGSIVETALSTWWRTSVGIGGTTGTVDGLQLSFQVSGEQVA